MQKSEKVNYMWSKFLEDWSPNQDSARTKDGPPVWAVCFTCKNRDTYMKWKDKNTRVCHKCVRNSFAPSGEDKTDWNNREIEEVNKL